MKIFLCGAGGMLGQSLSRLFSGTKYEVIASTQDTLDLTDAVAVQAAILAVKPDFVINAAAYTKVDAAETEKELAFAVNELGVANLVKAVQELDIPLIHFSTDYVFRGDNAKGYEEQSIEFGPLNVYGQSKLAGDFQIINNLTKYYLIRISWLYGEFGPNFVNAMLKLAKTQPEIKVVNDQIGRPTYAEDLAQMVYGLLEGFYPWGIYHGVNEVSGEVPGISWYDFAQEIFQFADVKVNLLPVDSSQFVRPAKRPPYSILLNTKYPALPDWRSSLKRHLGTLKK
ncbi:MAG TPA: dTDP-4-dehydrorhamnose reductase [bacterium]|nr:dTDP-4-dehydrorhamnose reductase [bacterium]